MIFVDLRPCNVIKGILRFKTIVPTSLVNDGDDDEILTTYQYLLYVGLLGRGPVTLYVVYHSPLVRSLPRKL